MTGPAAQPSGAAPERLEDFCALHIPALQRDQVRHNIIISILDRALAQPAPGLQLWTLGPAGCCAVMAPGRPITLGDLDQQQCRALAARTLALDYAGVVGPGDTGPWFSAHATSLGVPFGEPMPQRILALDTPPRHPGAQGRARAPAEADLALVADWVKAFILEVVPHDPVPPRDDIVRRVRDGAVSLWEAEGRPVSMAAVVRRTRDTGAISSVYTPADARGRGYAGAVTAAVVERIFADGRSTACLYTDARNPYSNRCYEKIGFRQVCDSWFFPRERSGC